MAFILALLVAAGRLIEGEPKPGRRAVQTAWSLCWKGALILVACGLLVMLHREFWKPSKGLNDGAMFLPVVGSIHAAFFSEVGWIVYFIEVIPLLAIASGALRGIEVVMMKRASESGALHRTELICPSPHPLSYTSIGYIGPKPTSDRCATGVICRVLILGALVMTDAAALLRRTTSAIGEAVQRKADLAIGLSE